MDFLEKSEMRSVVLIPARYASTRFPGKPLVNLLGKPMILWVAELSAEAVGKENVYIATDDDRIATVVSGAGFQFVMTSDNCLTGTDRLAEAASKIEADIYINVQGDEPLVNPSDILEAVRLKKENMQFIYNGYCIIAENENPESVNIPKVVTSESDDLIYISRKAVPGFKENKNAPEYYKKQVCIYAFTKDELIKFCAFGRKSILEKSEDIEILRFFELGLKIKMFQTEAGSLAVDIPEDINAVEIALKKLHNI